MDDSSVPQAQDVVKCQHCKINFVEYICNICGIKLCSNCHEAHETGHSTVNRPTASVHQYHPPQLTERLCRVHPTQRYEVCCHDCRVPICTHCIIGAHNKHKMTNISDVYEDDKSSLQEDVGEMKQKILPEVDYIINNAKSEKGVIPMKYKEIKSLMQIQAKSLKHQVDIILKESEQELDEMESKDVKTMAEHIKFLEDFQKKLQQTIHQYETEIVAEYQSDVILFRRNHPDISSVKSIPETYQFSPPVFKAGKIDKVNAKLFGDLKISSMKKVRIKKPRRKSKNEKTRNFITSAAVELSSSLTVPGSFQAVLRRSRNSDDFDSSSVLPNIQQSSIDLDISPTVPAVPTSQSNTDITLLVPNISAGPTLSRSFSSSRCIKEFKRSYSVLSNLCRASSNKVWISGQHPDIKLIDLHAGLMDLHHTECGNTGPTGLAVTDDGSVLYSNFDDKTITKISAEKEKKILVTTEWSPKGLCCTRSGDILVCLVNNERGKVARYTKTGELIKEFTDDENGRNLFVQPTYVCENEQHDIYVSDTGKRIVTAVNENGKLLFAYEGVSSHFDPRGMARDGFGNVAVADYSNHDIQVISPSGEFVMYILAHSDGLLKPCDLYLDKDHVWIAECRSGKLRIFKR